MQRTSFKTEAAFKKANPELVQQLMGRLADYQLTIPRIDVQPDRGKLLENYLDKYRSLQEWFLGQPNHPSELGSLQNETTETIRRIARFAQRLGERSQAFRSRRHDYLHLAGWFGRIAEIGDAHKLSALLFGVSQTRHFYGGPRASDDIDRQVWEEAPTMITLLPRVVGYRGKSRPGAVIDLRNVKRETLREYIALQRRNEALIDRLIVDQRIVLADLPEIDPYVRKTLLGWITRYMHYHDGLIQTETGRKIRLIEDRSGKRIVLRCSDGALEMPNFILEFYESQVTVNLENMGESVGRREKLII
jgi:uncharacterized protein (TIGR02677 family)